jgi:hypothetical protein
MNLSTIIRSATLIGVVVLVGCRQSPVLPTQQSTGEVRSYVGIGEPATPPANILLLLNVSAEEPTSFTGSITYRSATSTLTNIYVDSLSDSLYFEYARQGSNYSSWAQLDAFDMVLNYLVPSGVSPIQLNLEVDGHNMTGMWTGEMFSELAQVWRTSDFLMNQVGGNYDGAAQVDFVEPWQFQLASGTTSAGSFELSGQVYGSDSYPSVWQGTYSGFDSISGSWYAGTSEMLADQGEFYFIRSFR